jgi:hypothetical protein
MVALAQESLVNEMLRGFDARLRQLDREIAGEGNA